ncbi:MAG: hypothetical protein AUJ49_06440 [Desulfovibrionaceae bacterium CG1_02_65_16]|nr:MAG: hypothetical protein AUJ49_06440 [Desulfovibrionaceae bacterium CG1_02_65_16]
MTEHTQGADIAPAGPSTAEAACAQAEAAQREAYLESLKSQIRSGVYQPDIRDLARSLASMMVQKL